MKLKEATIYGFGKWIDYTIDFSGDSFLCIFGENESGKSTLQRFILFVLFGLPPKKRAYFRPKTSSRMGGRLTVYDTNIGEYTIERLDGTRNGAAICYTRDGMEHDEEWLKKRLNGMTMSIFQSIYSFDATDLSKIQNMNQEDIGDVLLSISLTGSTQIHSIEKQLDEKISALFKPFGTKPKLNQQVDKLEELAKEVQKHQLVEHTYQEKKDKQELLMNEKEQLQEDLNTRKEKVLQTEKKLQALPYIHELNTYKEQLNQLPQESQFPENGINRLEILKENILPLRSEQTILQTDENKYKQEKQKLEHNLNQSFNIHDARAILEQKQDYLHAKQQAKKLQTTIQQVENDINRHLSDLDIGLSEEQIAHLQLPFHTENKWNDLKYMQDELVMEKEQLTEEEQLLKNKQTYLRDSWTECKQKRLSQEDRAMFDKKVQQNHEMEVMQYLKEETEKKRATWKKEQMKVQKQNQLVLLGSIILSIILISIYVPTDKNTFLNLGIISFIVGILYWSWGTFSIKNVQRLMPEEQDVTKTSQYTEEEIEEAHYYIQKDQALENEEKSISAQMKDNDIKILQNNEKWESWNIRNNRFKEQLEEEQHHYPFLSKVEITYWPKLFHTLKDILRLYQEKKEARAEVLKLEKIQVKVTEEIAVFGQKVNLNNDLPVEKQFAEIERLDIEFKERESRLAQLNQFLEENRNRHEKLAKKIDTYENELNHLFELANVSDEEMFYKKARDIEKVNELKNSIHKIHAQFFNVFSPEEWEALIQSTPSESTLEIECQDQQTSIMKIEKQLEKIRQQIADLQAELVNMETNQLYPQSLQEMDMEKSKLQEMAKEWAVLKTAKETLVETKQVYQDKYLHHVLERTETFFKELTNGYYKHIYTPHDEESFIVETKDHIRYTVNELSQGTINQLYVSLRLAISEVRNENDHFPFIIDDAFVHFDTIRTKRILNILQRQSKEQQILLFTCKQNILDCFTQNNVIELEEKVVRT